MVNKIIGNRLEEKTCRELAKAGFWAHNFANRKNGQPADIIAVKNNRAFLIDAKACTRGVFEFKRIEENQRYSMEKWEECGNGSGWFALGLEGKIYFISYRTLEEKANGGELKLNADAIKKQAYELERWAKIWK